jgi:Icc-related predicted phosphoesterase
MGTKTLFISDVKGKETLESNLKKLNFDVDQIVVAGDLLNSNWIYESNPREKGRDELRIILKKLKDYSKEVILLPGNRDLLPNFCKDILAKLEIFLLAEKLYEGVYTSRVFEGKGYSLISWGSGAGIGGIIGYIYELELVRNRMFPHSTLVLSNSSYIQSLTPKYSGYVFYKAFTKKLKEAKSERKIVVSHMPPYMGNDIPWLSNPITTNERLDVVSYSKVKGVEYLEPTHVGCIFFRKALNENHKNIHSVYFGHVEEGKGESWLANTYLRNLGSFEELCVVEL